jgi:hypothetical protein
MPGTRGIKMIRKDDVSDREVRSRSCTPEIEVTPAMIEAGKKELCGFDPEIEGWAAGAEKIIRAALANR